MPKYKEIGDYESIVEYGEAVRQANRQMLQHNSRIDYDSCDYVEFEETNDGNNKRLVYNKFQVYPEVLEDFHPEYSFFDLDDY